MGMEFDTNLKENLSFHPSLFSEKPFEAHMENVYSAGSSWSEGLYQKFPNLDQSSIEGSSSNLSLGILTPFYDPFDPFLFNASTPSGSNGVHHFMHGCQNIGGSLSYPPRTLFQALNQGRASHPLNYQEFGLRNANLSDEFSCLTVEDGDQTKADLKKKKKKKVQPKGSSKGLQKQILVKGQWTPEEDRLLMQLVKQCGEKRWSHIAQMLDGRVGKQCRERWHNHLRPDIKKSIWSEEEEMMLIEAHRQVGNKWAAIARKMPGRTENNIKNHWNVTKRRLFSKRKGKYCSSLLQEYINSLASDSAGTNHPESPCPFLDSDMQTVDTSMVHPRLQTEISDLEHKDQTVPKTCDFPFDAKMCPEGYGFGSMFEEMPFSCVDHDGEQCGVRDAFQIWTKRCSFM